MRYVDQSDPGTSRMLSSVGRPKDQDLHSWCSLVYGSLRPLDDWVGVSTFKQLLDYVMENRLYPFAGNFTDVELKLMSFYAKNCSNQVPGKFETSPPNHVIFFIHWQILCTFLRKLSPEKHIFFRTPRQSCGGLNSGNITVVVDSHFHLDQMFVRGIISLRVF